MKKYYLPFITFLLFNCLSLKGQVGIQWSAPIDVSITSGNKSPIVGILENGSPALIWGNGSKILFSKMVDNAFITPIELSTGGNTPDIYSFGGIDMDIKENQIFIVFENFDNGVFIIKSSDSGDSFQAPVNVYNPLPGKWATLPSVVIDDSGNPLVSVILENTNETQGQHIMMRSIDGGATFGPPIVANEPAAGDFVCECCPADIYTQGEDIWFIFRNNDNNLRDMWVCKSENNGDNFNIGTDVDATDWVLNACPIAGPKIAPLLGDSLITFWKSGGGGGSRVYISTLDGATMEKGTEFIIPQTNPNSFQSSPNIAGAQDTIGIVWAETGFGANTTDLMFAYSTNGSIDLISNMANITQAPSVQSIPSLSFSNGVFHLFHTNGSGLQYRKGDVSDAVSLNSNIQNNNCFTIIENPIKNNSINLKNSCNTINSFLQAEIIDLSGKVIYRWDKQLLNEYSEISFDVLQIPAGIYLLSIYSKSGFWSEKIMIGE
jgi:type IX secretion system substrate protein